MNEYNPYVIDIETNSLLANMLDYSSLPYKLNTEASLWCVVIRNVVTNEVKKAIGSEVTREWMKTSLEGATHLIGHNGIKFDFIALKLFGVLDYRVGYLDEPDLLFGNEVVIVDSLILSRLANPDRYKGHSLESWGERLGNSKTDFRAACIEAGLIEKNAPAGAEFMQPSEIMYDYCEQDTNVNRDAFIAITEELGEHAWQRAIKVENKLADQAVRRESFGFDFDKSLALKHLEELLAKMEELRGKVDPILPLKPMTKTEVAEYTPPKTQIKKDGELAAAIVRFTERIGAVIDKVDEDYYLIFEGKEYLLPYHEPLKTHVKASIDNLDHVKMHLISLGWEPKEWRERDLTKDSKKQNLPYEKRVTAMERWVKETFEGKYKYERLEQIKENFGVWDECEIIELFREKLREDKPIRIPTSPTVRVGVEKELCPNLVSLGEKVSFANDFALYLTFKHRKASIAGGDIEDMDFDNETPNTGYLALYREVDGRIPTPAIEIGASTNRYRHIGVANIPRATSIYGKEMRSLFGSGVNGLEFGYDFASLEARIMGHYVMRYENGAELAESMLAEKPNDIHSRNALKLGIHRNDAKSLTYGILYGAQPKKIAKMLRVPMERAKEIYNDFWEAVPALKQLKEKAEAYWESTGKKFILGIDGRKIMIRSKHSILNALFQSAGVICAKYVNVFSMEYLEKLGYNIDPFEGEPDILEMIAYHDECQLFVKKSLIKFKTFTTEDEAKEFVKSWKGEQLSAISEGNTWYVTLPNDISEGIEQSIRKTEKLLKLNVPLGFEWIVNKTWYGCH